MENWIPTSEKFPKTENKVLVFARSISYPKYTVITCAAHVGVHEVTTEDWRDYEGNTEYDEDKDCFWVCECWYEINSSDDNPNYELTDYDVLFWMELPQEPNIAEE